LPLARHFAALNESHRPLKTPEEGSFHLIGLPLARC